MNEHWTHHFVEFAFGAVFFVLALIIAIIAMRWLWGGCT